MATVAPRERPAALWTECTVVLSLQPEYSMDFISRELFVHSAKKLQAHVLLLKAIQGYYNVRRENDSDRNVLLFVMDTLQSVLKEVGARGSARVRSRRVLTHSLH